MRAEVCIICHIQCDSLEKQNLMKLRDFLFRKELDTRNIKEYRHFTWGNGSLHCPYGLYCSKIESYRSELGNLTRELDILLSAYIEQTDRKDYVQILTYMQGYFPAAYRYFEREVKRR